MSITVTGMSQRQDASHGWWLQVTVTQIEVSSFFLCLSPFLRPLRTPY